QPGQLPALGRAPERAPRRALDRAAARARRDRSRRARHRAGLAALRRAAGAAGADPHQRGRAASPDREQVLRRRDLRRAARAAADRDLRPRAVPRDRRRPDRRRPRERQRPDGARDGRRRAQVPPGRPRTGLPGDDGGGRLRAARLAAGGVGDAAMDLLTGMTFLPLAAGLVLLAAGSRLPDAVWRWAGLAATTATFLLSLRLWVGFDPAQGGYQFVHHVPWIADYGINWFVGIDGMSLLLVLLTTFLMPLVLLGSWNDVQRSVKPFVFFNLALETGMLGAFVSLNLFQFYVFWEVMLIPMYFIIGIWGGPRRVYAAVKFFLFTMAGSLPMLVAILALYVVHAGQFGAYTFDLITPPGGSGPGLLATLVPVAAGEGVPWWQTQPWLFAAFALAFAVKVPVVPLHTWLPDAHVEAPTAGSVVLAGVLLKMGTYGFVRF